MTFEERIQTLRAEKSRTSFSFHFIDLYSEEEWMNMSVKQRTRQEREFIAQLDQIPRVRMPFSSQKGYKFKLYNQEYQYNEVKKNFKDL
ncbi:DUF1413 domain-containing protein [Staphylococcus haemolyticus]|uniref:DUF1413 domain-containing protein n=1 Tax=Staphylococcus haemolyticus TaxID=1283 RepID=UPI001F0B6230|nr:DUF1413 domain-containing protein [Staphylococcus haemolyticus]MCH4520312.1 single-stranded DNA-binding protein [Staphylococcus haemolyticus]